MGTNFDDDQLENEFIIMGTTLNSDLTSQKIIVRHLVRIQLSIKAEIWIVTAVFRFESSKFGWKKPINLCFRSTSGKLECFIL